MQRLRSLLFAVLTLLFAPRGYAQSTPDVTSAEQQRTGIIVGLFSALVEAGDDLDEETSVPGLGKWGGFVGLQTTPRTAVGLSVSILALQRREETVQLESGRTVDLTTATDIYPVALFGRYGPRWGLVHPYTEAVVGINVIATRTKLSDDFPGPPGPDDERSVAPAAGGGLGVGLRLADWLGGAVGFYAAAHRVFGGRADYTLFDPIQERYTERSSGTTMSSVSVGLTFAL